jgi:hypothetical protein
MIGVNRNVTDAKQLKEVVDKEQMNWRSFAASDTIKAKWNDPGTPMYYVIDHMGVIRHKWYGNPGEHAMESSLQALIEMAQRSQKKGAK